MTKLMDLYLKAINEGSSLRFDSGARIEEVRAANTEETEQESESIDEAKKADRFHIVDQSGNPANLVSYGTLSSAMKDRDEKHPTAKIHLVGPRGKVKHVFEPKSVKEDFDQLDEISKETLGKYVQAASQDNYDTGKDVQWHRSEKEYTKKEKAQDRFKKRNKGIGKALARLTKEEVELEEEMTQAQMDKREDYVKGMKKNYKDFVSKYGARAKDVMYATATKMAMKEETELDEAIRTPEERLAVAKRNYEARLRSAQYPHERMDAKADYDHFHAAMQKEIAARKQKVSEEIDEAFESSKPTHYYATHTSPHRVHGSVTTVTKHPIQPYHKIDAQGNVTSTLITRDGKPPRTIHHGSIHNLLDRSSKQKVSEETELAEEGPSAGQRFAQAHRRPKPEDRIKKLETQYGKLTDHEQGLVHQGLDHIVHNLRNPNGPQMKSAVVRKEETDLNLEDFSLEELQDFMMSEDFEQLDELKKSTLASYVRKAGSSLYKMGGDAADAFSDKEIKKSFKIGRKADNREQGLHRAVTKLAKEEAELEEAHDAETYRKYALQALRNKSVTAGNKASYMIGANADRLGLSQKHNPYKSGTSSHKHWAKGLEDSVTGIHRPPIAEECELDLEDYSLEELQDFMMSEDFEQLDEISQKVLGAHIEKSKKAKIKLHKGEDDGKSGITETAELDEGQKVKTATGYIHKGSYGSEYDTDEDGSEKKKDEPEVKRGRGRPKKGSDESGNVKKYSFHSLLNRLSK